MLWYDRHVSIYLLLLLPLTLNNIVLNSAVLFSTLSSFVLIYPNTALTQEYEISYVLSNFTLVSITKISMREKAKPGVSHEQ